MQGETDLLEFIEDSPEISIHSPRAGGDHHPDQDDVVPVRFQSTPPMRGETTLPIKYHFFAKFQSTPPVQGETCSDANASPWSLISIHSPRAGGDA